MNIKSTSSHHGSNSGDYLSFRSDKLSVLINTGRLELRALLDSPDRLFEGALILKDSRSVKAARVETAEAGVFFLKRYNSKGFFYALRHILSKPRPAKVLRVSNLLRSAGVKTPQVLAAVFKYRYHLLLNTSYLITDYVENIIPPNTLIPGLLENKSYFTEYRNQVIFCLNHLHENCTTHGDLKIHNIYSRDTAAGLEVGLLDLDSVECYKSPLTAKTRAKDLARFVASIIQVADSNHIAIDQLQISEFIITEYERVSGFSLDREYISRRIKHHICRKRK